MAGKLGRLVFRTILLATVVSVAVVALFRFVAPPGTPLMLIRKFDERYSGRVVKRWVPLHRISRNAVRAVIAAEDARFCSHFGFDFDAINKALEKHRRGGRLRGASTITQQTAKNLFLWPDRDYVRKGLEAWFTVLIEVIWPKDRVLEVYLNVVEWGDGIYGIEAASRRYFRRPASRLSARQAALLASVLPNPRVFSPIDPGPSTQRKAAVVLQRMSAVAAGRGRICR